MKTNKILSILSFFIFSISIISCVEDNDFEVPNISVSEPDITTTLTVAKVQQDLTQEFNSNGNLTLTYRVNDTPTYVSGYVVSSDAAGNFFKTLVVQDKPENPTAGIEILVNNSSLSQTYQVGRKVFIKLDGLTVTYDDGESSSRISPVNGVPGVYTLGLLSSEGRVSDIPSTTYRDVIVKSAEVAEIIPTAITIDAIEDKNVNTLVQLESAQFAKNELGRTYAGEANDQFDGFRNIFECGTENTIPLQTSTFASFKSNIVATGSGKATAILAKDFRAEFFVLVANSPADLDFSNPERCDPPVLDCGTGAVGGSTVLLDETFDSYGTTADVEAAGWTNINANGGATTFSLRSFSGNKYMQGSAFRTGENPLEMWLISPAVNLNGTTNEELTFETKTGFNNGEALSVWVSTDYTGDVAAATWLRVDATLANGPSSGFEPNFTQSGSINLSCLDGDVYVAFRYAGGDGGVTTTFQVENVRITGQ
ncbi:DUF5689 domain-containing protein [Tenacibaculum amylolyticum]|uniref:DUF5689 domain-containing protein n=1 Tax=Tenacibaculum amylolyticum TaxID=104269 RepID=UPI003895CBFE